MDVTFTAWAALAVGLVLLLCSTSSCSTVPGTRCRYGTPRGTGFIAVGVGFGMALGLLEGSTVAGSSVKQLQRVTPQPGVDLPPQLGNWRCGQAAAQARAGRGRQTAKEAQ